MGEPFSVAVGALQVAGAGLQLAKTLYEYVEGIQSANRHIKALASEVRTTSSTLKEFGTLLQQHDAEKLCSQSIVSDASATFDACKIAFNEVEQVFKKVVTRNKNGEISVPTSERFTWPFKQGKVETLQANLERLKTTLLLMLGVMSFARERSKKSGSA